MTPDRPRSNKKENPGLKQGIAERVVSTAEGIKDFLDVDIIVLSISFAVLAVAYGVIHNQKEQEACLMMEAGKALQDGHYLTKPKFVAASFRPKKEIPYCEKEFGISIHPDDAKKSYEKSFSQKERDKAEKAWF